MHCGITLSVSELLEVAGFSLVERVVNSLGTAWHFRQRLATLRCSFLGSLLDFLTSILIVPGRFGLYFSIH
jgi:hypothetical protein